MKTLFTLVIACFVFTLNAQTNFEPATSLLDENATASINNDMSYLAAAPATVEKEELVEVENYFNIRFTSNPIFGDINIVYDLSTTSTVTVEVVKDNQTIFSSNKLSNAGTQETVWDENISIGSGVHIIKITADNKVESKRIRL